jgi:hypothetical protein
MLLIYKSISIKNTNIYGLNVNDLLIIFNHQVTKILAEIKLEK